jgi:hypothetical protein
MSLTRSDDYQSRFTAKERKVIENQGQCLGVDRPSDDCFLSRPGCNMQVWEKPTPRGTVLPRAVPSLTVCCPEIETARRELTNGCGDAPSESEVADKLRIRVSSYRRVRQYAKAIEEGALFGEYTEHLEGEEASDQLQGPPGGDHLFTSARLECQGLLKEAIQYLPQSKHLILSLSYSEDSLDGERASLGGRLEIAGDTGVGASYKVFVSVRATIVQGESWHRAEVRPVWDIDPLSPFNHAGLSVRSAVKRRLYHEGLQVYVSGSHSGWVPTERSRDLFGWRETWDNFFMSWYRINDDQTLEQIRRQERVTRHVGMRP